MTIEADWVRQALQGDEGSWERLVAEHQQPVFRLAYLLVGDPDDAEDIAQETFVRAYRSLNRFDPARPLRPWLLRIASHQASNHRRGAARYLGALQRLLFQSPPAPSTQHQAEYNVDQSREAAQLWQAVRQLSQADQQVIYLRFFLECSEGEMAQVLEVAAGTVKSRLHRALDRLTLVLRQEYPQLEKEIQDAR